MSRQVPPALAALLAIGAATNDLYMLIAPAEWYFAVPGVTTTGPFNQHFLRDARRETYIGAWLPEPLMGVIDAQDTVADDITVTLMLAMERLSPLERAAFLLHDVFDIALTDVATTLGREPAAVRQLASRARKHVQHARPRYTVEAAEGERIARAFFAAARDGDAAALATLLSRDVEIHSDGGGKVIAFRNIVRGIDRALRLFAGLRRKHRFTPKLLRIATINGLPGYVSIDRGDVLQTTALDVRDGRIGAIYIVRNPDKLRHVADMVGIDRSVEACWKWRDFDMPRDSGRSASALVDEFCATCQCDLILIVLGAVSLKTRSFALNLNIIDSRRSFSAPRQSLNDLGWDIAAGSRPINDRQGQPRADDRS
jgi:hypothetical protein